MAYPDSITKFAQSVYLVVKNRYFDDIEEADGQTFIEQVIDWTNQYLDELETVVDASGQVVNWNWLRSLDSELGTANFGDNTLDLDEEILNLIASPDRPLKIVKDGKVVSKWTVVSPGQVAYRDTINTVTKVGDSLFFSREFNDSEDDGTIVADVTTSVPRIVGNIYDAITTVKPKQLLILGVAKSMSLPDIVQGGLSPSYVQKYNDLLQQAIILNNATAESNFSQRDDNSNIGGIY